MLEFFQLKDQRDCTKVSSICVEPHHHYLKVNTPGSVLADNVTNKVIFSPRLCSVFGLQFKLNGTSVESYVG